MVDAHRPWARITDPAAVPRPCSGVRLRLLDEERFGHLVASELVPGPDREAHRLLWAVLASNNDLTMRAFDLLDLWLGSCRHAVGTIPQDTGRVRKFQGFVEAARRRLLLIRRKDLNPHNEVSPRATSFTGALVAAIHEHQAAVVHPRSEDWALWAAVLHARGRRLRKGNRGRDSGGVSRYWHVVPTYSQQLIQAIRDHAELTPALRPADRQLRETINNPPTYFEVFGVSLRWSQESSCEYLHSWGRGTCVGLVSGIV